MWLIIHQPLTLGALASDKWGQAFLIIEIGQSPIIAGSTRDKFSFWLLTIKQPLIETIMDHTSMGSWEPRAVPQHRRMPRRRAVMKSEKAPGWEKRTGCLNVGIPQVFRSFYRCFSDHSQGCLYRHSNIGVSIIICFQTPINWNGSLVTSIDLFVVAAHDGRT